ncbi:MAG: glycosyltransferase family 2 protein [Isosphaeraceae bacterium]|nr:glycosyltransferase family 2 protein [Isosphaeraceae bacterium]
MQFSIVIPVFNGARTISALVERLLDLLGGSLLEIILVNDGSPDDSDEVCREIRERRPDRVVYVELAKNFGEHNAVMAGLHQARGEYVVIMDDDFQNPPEEVAKLVAFAEENRHDVVYTRYAKKQHAWWRNLGSRFNDFAACILLDKPRGLYLSSFKCLSRFAVREVVRYSGPYPYVDGLLLRATRRIGTVEVRHDPRAVGRSNYTLRKLVRLWLNMFVNFSILPLRIAGFLGLALAGVGLLLAVVAVIEKLRDPSLPLGWASLQITIVTFSGVQLLTLGILGEYLGRMFLTGNQTPQFVVREISTGDRGACPIQKSNSRPFAEPESSSPAAWDFSVATSRFDWSTSDRG